MSGFHRRDVVCYTLSNHVDVADITVATFEEPAAAIEWAGEAYRPDGPRRAVPRNDS